MLYIGGRKATFKDGELSKTYLEVVLKQLGLDKNFI